MLEAEGARIPTLALTQALQARRGPLYIAALAAVQKANPNLSPVEVEAGLIADLLGPFTPEDVLTPRRRVALIPSQVIVASEPVDLLESHP